MDMPGGLEVMVVTPVATTPVESTNEEKQNIHKQHTNTHPHTEKTHTESIHPPLKGTGRKRERERERQTHTHTQRDRDTERGNATTQRGEEREINSEGGATTNPAHNDTSPPNPKVDSFGGC